jgi:hypothetical protein
MHVLDCTIAEAAEIMWAEPVLALLLSWGTAAASFCAYELYEVAQVLLRGSWGPY